MTTFQDLYSKALTDDAFRQQLAADPEAALRSINIQPTPEIVKNIRQSIASLQAVQQAMAPPAALGGTGAPVKEQFFVS